MNKKSTRSTDETAYSIHKTLNVFSLEDFQKEYLLLIRKVFGISAAAAKLYQHVYQAEQVDNFVYIDQKELIKSFSKGKKIDIPAALSELIDNGLVTESGQDRLFCMNPEEAFDPLKHEKIKLTFTIEKKLAITEEEKTAKGKEEADAKESIAVRKAGKNEELKTFLKEEFEYTDKELKEINEVFVNESLTSKKFYKKIEEWKTAMPRNSTKAQKKNYLSACFLNEEWNTE